MTVHEVYRDGTVHVLADKCATCIFRSVNDGRIQGLNAGRVAGMVLEARKNESCIPCHMTIYDDDVRPAICRGFYDLPNPPTPIQIAERMGFITFDPVPAKP